MSTLDACFAAAAFGPAAGPVAAHANVLPVQSSHTLVGARAWAHVLCIALAAPATVTLADLPLDYAPSAGDAGALLYAGWREASGGAFDVMGLLTPDAPLALAAAPDPHDWSLHHIAPVFASGWAFLGEPAKLVPVSTWRVAAVADTGAGVRVDARGDAGEAVTLAFARPEGAGAWAVVELKCVLGGGGTAVFAMDAAGGACA